ncbi:MAG: DEAD/DEAH box helicase [Archaeoglobaceae archaeon]
MVLEGKDVVIVAPTASGKTEAVVAPLIERYLKENWEGLAILYISPTRALVNDLYERLKEQLHECGVKLALKTGDKPYFNPKQLPNFLITTPESFDSLLCRQPLVFKKLKAVVLDEIHLIHNTFRGDQIYILLKRLSTVTETKFNIYALSATIASPENIGKRFLREYEVVKCEGKNEIEFTLVNSLEEVFEYAKKEALKKLLIFANTRKKVETIGYELKKLWGEKNVVVHHGSLSRREREEAERFMKESPRGVCIATMTLEVGIDIGDIDAVVLAEVPWSVSSFIQRIGRGNRRTHKHRVLALFTSEEERIILEKMLAFAREGIIEEENYSPDLSVVVQQIFSSLYANRGGLSDEYFSQLFHGFCSQQCLSYILMHLQNLGWIEKHNGKWYATTKLMDFGERGKIHSNIPDIKAFKVINTATQKEVGEVYGPIDECFMLAGKVWKVVNVEQDKIFAIQINAEAYVAKFAPRVSRAAFYDFLPPELQEPSRARMCL